MKKIFILFQIILSINLYGSNQLIAIDIGHTPKKYGAKSARGITEYEFNKKIAYELHQELTNKNINSFIINNQSNEISLIQRTKKAKELNASLFISIHHDSAQKKYFNKWKYNKQDMLYSDNFSGYSLLISLSNPFYNENLKIANLIGTSFLNNNLTPTLHHSEKIIGENRTLIDSKKGIYQFDELAVLRTAQMPAILIECGVIVNRNEELKLNDKKYRKRIINSIVSAIERLN